MCLGHHLQPLSTMVETYEGMKITVLEIFGFTRIVTEKIHICRGTNSHVVTIFV